MANGQTITDGTVTWQVRDMRSVASTEENGLMSKDDKTKLEKYPALSTTDGTKFINSKGELVDLPKAAKNTLGVVKQGDNISIDSDGKISVSKPLVTNQSSVFLRGDGTWATIPSASSGSSSSSSGTDSDVFNALKDLPILQGSLDDSLFLNRAGKWESLYVYKPSPIIVGRYNPDTEYDHGFQIYSNHFTFETINTSTVTTYYNTIKGYTSNHDEYKYTKIIKDEALQAYSALKAIEPGVYILKITPKIPYVWGDDEFKNTRTPKYVYWIIRKAINTITLSSEDITVDYFTTAEISVTTADGTNLTTVSRDERQIITEGWNKSDAQKMRNNIPWNAVDAYQLYTVSEGKITFTLLWKIGYNPWANPGRLAFLDTTGTLIVKSNGNERYLPDKKKISYHLAKAQQSLSLQNQEQSSITMTSNVYTLILNYESDHLPTMTKPTGLEVKTLEEYANEIISNRIQVQHTTAGYFPNADDPANPNKNPKIPAPPVVAELDQNRTKLWYPLYDDDGNRKLIQNDAGVEVGASGLYAVGSLVSVQGGVDHAGTEWKNSGVIDKDGNIQHYAVRGPDGYWYFVGSEYTIKAAVFVQENLSPDDWRYNPNDAESGFYKPMDLIHQHVFKQYNKLILFLTAITPQASGTLTLNTNRDDLITQYEVYKENTTTDTDKKDRIWRSGLWYNNVDSISISIKIDNPVKNLITIGERMTTTVHKSWYHGSWIHPGDTHSNTEDNSEYGLPLLSANESNEGLRQLYNDGTMTLEWLDQVSKKGQAGNYIRIGDYFRFTMQRDVLLDSSEMSAEGQIASKKIPVDYTTGMLFAVVIGINHDDYNEDLASFNWGEDSGVADDDRTPYTIYNAIHFMVGYNSSVGLCAINGKRMKTSAHNWRNYGGWLETDLRHWLNSTQSDRSPIDYTNQGFYANLPPRLQRFIKPYKKINTAWYGPDGTILNDSRPKWPGTNDTIDPGTDPSKTSFLVNQTNASYYVEQKGTADKIWILNYREVSGGKMVYIYDNAHSLVYEYFRYGNSRIAYEFGNEAQPITWWLRDTRTNNANAFSTINQLGNFASSGPENIYGFMPCFVI